MHRFPEDIDVTVDVAIAALILHGDIVDNASDCHALWQRLSTAARNAAEAEKPDWPTVKALWLIADACSMMMTGDSTNSPFGPLAIFENGRTALPEDFGPVEIALFAEVSKKVQNRVLRARLADLAWIVPRRKNVEDARRAIDAYIEQQPTEENSATSLEEWKRAVTLCLQLRQGAEARLDKIKQDLERIAETELLQNGSIGRAVAMLLFDRRLANADEQKFAELLAVRGESILNSNSDLWNARAYLELAAQWFNRLGNPERESDMIVKIALSFEAEANQRIALDPRNGHLVAQAFLGDAIQTLRKVRKDQRPLRNIDEELERLTQLLTQTGEKVVSSLQTISSGTTDITKIVELSEKAVRGKDALPALISLARLHPGANLAAMTRFAEEMLRTHVFSRLAGTTHISRDGRVIAKTPVGGLDDTSELQKDMVFGKIMQHYWVDMNLVCNGQILPALRAFIQEHTIRKTELTQLMSLAPIVPPGRSEQFSKGLWEGFEGDFASAIYLLAPQVEHLVRWHLKQIGATTTNLDLGGIENEVGLSSLVDMPELSNIFDENTIFELRALFCTALGPNLRNEVAHGLLSAEEGNSVASIYAWWWILRLALRSYVNSRFVASQPSASDTDAAFANEGHGQSSPTSIDLPAEQL